MINMKILFWPQYKPEVLKYHPGIQIEAKISKRSLLITCFCLLIVLTKMFENILDEKMNTKLTSYLIVEIYHGYSNKCITKIFTRRHFHFFLFLCFVRSHMFDVSRWEGWNLPFWVWAKRVGFGSEKSMDKPTLLSNLRLRHQVSV